MTPRDPTADEEPDFKDESWEGARTAIIGGGKTAEEAVEILRQCWRAKHDRDVTSWTGHLRQERKVGQVAREKPMTAAAPTTEPPERSNPPDWVNLPTPNVLDIRPARHILKRLGKKEFVELWHFTAEGCKDAATIDLATPNDTFGSVGTNSCLALQTIRATKTSHRVIRDENLSYVQFTEARTRMIGWLKTCGWSEHETSQLVSFYISLDVHPIRARPYGLDAIMRYQERVRRDWTANLKAGTPYSITQVNNELIKDCRDEISGEIQAKHNVSLVFQLATGRY